MVTISINDTTTVNYSRKNPMNKPFVESITKETTVFIDGDKNKPLSFRPCGNPYMVVATGDTWKALKALVGRQVEVSPIAQG